MAKELPAKVKLTVLDGLSKTLDNVKAKFPDLSRAVMRTNTAFKVAQETTGKLKSNLEKIGGKISGLGKSITLGVGLPAAAAAGFAVKKFSDIEDALTDIKGSANLSGDELKQFGARISQVSKTIAVPQDELLKLAGVAGDIGIRGVDNLEKFTVTLSQLHKVAGIAAEDSAEPLKQMLELTGEGVGSIDKFGSALAAVGDKYGVSAKKVLESTFMITREISKFGVSSSQAIALAAAVEPLGFNAKQASGAVGDAFRAIDESIRKGGQNLTGLRLITGMTAEELKTQFGKDPVAVFEKFVEGINKIKQKGGDTAKALQFFGASGEKTQIILEALGKDTSKLNEIMKFSGEEFAANTALGEKYAEATSTFSSKLQLLNNRIVILAVKLGEVLVPVLTVFINILTWIADFFDSHPFIARFTATIIGLVAVFGVLLTGIGYFVGTIMPAMVLGFEVLSSVVAGFTFILTPLLALLGTFTWPVWAAVAALTALGLIFAMYSDKIFVAFADGWDWITGKIKGFIDLVKTALGLMSNITTPTLATAGTPIAGGAQLLPQGAPVGGLEAQSQMNPEFSTQTNNARVDINVRAPQSTSIVSESQGGFLNINRGLVGAF